MSSNKSVRFAESSTLDLEIENGEWEDIIEEQVQEQEKELTIQEEYKLWRKNCHYMYDFISETALTWPSLSIQWLPQHIKQANNSVSAKLLLSTHTSGEDIDYIKIASTQLPLNLMDPILKPTEQINSKLKISKKLKQNSEINRVRYSPVDANLISSINGEGEVFVYNLTDSTPEPTELKHHKENGFGLSWNFHEKNSLLTGSDDKTILIWDITSQAPTSVVESHTDIVNDVKWSPHSPDIFGSVSDDKSFKYFDKRQSTTKPVIDLSNVSKFEINSLSFSPFSKNLFVIGGSDNNLTLFDLRKPEQSLHQMIGHTDSITTIEWSPLNENIILSGSNDRRCILWDLNSIGKELLPDDAEDGVAELLFMHGGHTGAINDLSFNPEIPFCLASASNDNIVHIWKVSEKISGGDDKGYDDIDLSKLE